jgi:hypothetical protein
VESLQRIDFIITNHSYKHLDDQRMFSSGFLTKNLQFSISPCIPIYIKHSKASVTGVQQQKIAVFSFYNLLRLYSRNYIQDHQQNYPTLLCFS